MKDSTRSLTIDDYKPLKIAYDKAVEEGLDMFTFKGNEVLTNYAKYLIEYVEMNMEDEK